MPTLSPRAAAAINVALYYTGWLACVVGAAAGRWAAGTLLACGLAGVHLALARRRAVELRLMLMVGAIGYAVDSAQTALGLLVFAQGQPLPGMAPLWIGALWVLFAATLRYALCWLSGRPLLGALLGALGGPAAFYAGHRLGAVSFHPSPRLSLSVLAVVWAVLLPLLVALATAVGGGSDGRYRLGRQ